jgi:hypothetical protein
MSYLDNSIWINNKLAEGVLFLGDGNFDPTKAPYAQISKLALEGLRQIEIYPLRGRFRSRVGCPKISVKPLKDSLCLIIF